MHRRRPKHVCRHRPPRSPRAASPLPVFPTSPTPPRYIRPELEALLPLEVRICRVLYPVCPICSHPITPGDTCFKASVWGPIRDAICYDCGIRLLLELDPAAAGELADLSPCMATRLPDPPP